MKRITITAPEFISGFMPQLPSSKSISNRLLILNELSPIKANISNLSAADDTQVLLQLLKENKAVQDCHDGGTTSRFLIALRCAQQAKVTITGSKALQRRPLAPLLKALSYLGAEFSFNTTTQHLPLKITKGIDRGGEVYISAEISSQFISALMMIAPILQGGLTIHLEGEIVSGTYLSTTAAIMSRFGVEPIFETDKIIISQQSYAATDTVVSGDWSAAGYWYAFAAALPGSKLLLKDILADGLQSDESCMSMMKAFGVSSEIVDDTIVLQSEPTQIRTPLQLDFLSCPDLAQTFAVLAAVKDIPLQLTGLKTLRGKETDRVAALIAELKKAGAEVESKDDSISIISGAKPEVISKAVFDTYNDHRMAMSLALLSTLGVPVSINDPDVVKKSYPGFWKDLESAGFTLRA